MNVLDEEEARRLMVEQYLASFGPATGNDVGWWTGFPKRQIREILRGFQGRVATIRISGLRGNYYLFSSGKPVLMSMKRPEKQVIKMLPGLDPYLMGYKDRQRYVDYEYYDFVFDRSGNATSTILVGGRVVGVWDFEGPVAKIFPFDNLEAALLKGIRAKAKEVGTFVSGREVRVKECDSMTPLPQRTAGGFMTPLRYS